ncbi:MAG: hypothetical protein Q8J89_13795 [Caulobacter sp.]|nr:hypothetical protein [Caulobacter sp.]
MRLFMFIALLVWLPLAAHAQSPGDEPEVYVASVYDRLANHRPWDTPDNLYSPRLAGLWEDMRRDAGDEVGRVNFDFWVNAQDSELSDFSFGGEPVIGNPDRRIVIARFRNLDRDEVIAFYWERIDGRWRLDDVQSLGADPWTLSVLLKYGWVGED